MRARLWLRSLPERLDIIWRVLTGPTPDYAVIYDLEQGMCDSEEYYGFFGTPPEAREMFNTAFGYDDKLVKGSAKLVVVLEDIQ